MNKFALLTAPFLCLGAAALFADAYNEHSMAENAFAQQSSGLLAANDQNGQGGQAGQNDKYGQFGSTGDMKYGQITPEAEPKVTHWADPYLTAEFIYWKAVEENLHWAYNGVNPGVTGEPDKGAFKNPDFDFEPGFKLGFGLRFKHDGWDLYANWTWLSEFEGDTHAETDEDSSVYTLYSTISVLSAASKVNQSTQFAFSRGHAEWEMNFNALDIELGRNFYISPYLTLRPHFGLKFGWIDQDYNGVVKDANIIGGAGSRGHFEMDQDFFGVGIRTGLDTVWYFAKHWGIYGDFAFSALWSDFHSKREDEFATPLLPKFEIAHYHRTLLTLTEVLELGLGFRYDTTFFVGDYSFYLQAGWEEQIWFNQNQFLDSRDTRSGNLTMHGLSVKAGLMF